MGDAANHFDQSARSAAQQAVAWNDGVVPRRCRPGSGDSRRQARPDRAGWFRRSNLLGDLPGEPPKSPPCREEHHSRYDEQEQHHHRAESGCDQRRESIEQAHHPRVTMLAMPAHLIFHQAEVVVIISLM